jgi:hypothetical protein
MPRKARVTPSLKPLTKKEMERIKKLPLRKHSQKVSNAILALFQQIKEYFAQWNQAHNDINQLGAGERKISKGKLVKFYNELAPADRKFLQERVRKITTHLKSHTRGVTGRKTGASTNVLSQSMRAARKHAKHR